MTGGIIAVIVLGLIAIARTKLGDLTYDKIVITFFKWMFGLTAAFIIGAMIYNKIFK